MQARTKNRLTLIGIFLLFLIPVVVAIVLNVFNFKTKELKNRGQLVEPPVLITDMSNAEWLEELKGTWTLIHRNKGACEKICEANMRDMHQIRVAMGRRADKLDLLVLTDKTPAMMMSPADVKVITIDDDPEIQQQLEALSTQSANENQSDFFIVAPEGYLMLSYGNNNTPPDIIKDLQRLLKRKGDAS